MFLGASLISHASTVKKKDKGILTTGQRKQFSAAGAGFFDQIIAHTRCPCIQSSTRPALFGFFDDNSFVIAAADDLASPGTESGPTHGRRIEGVFIVRTVLPPSWIVFISSSLTDRPPFSRSCVSYVRTNSISRDSFRSSATYKLFPTDPRFVVSFSFLFCYHLL